MIKRAIPACFLLVLSPLYLSASLHAQKDQPPVFRTNVEVVNVLATVRASDGSYVSDLTKDEFEVYEEGIPQEIQYFQFESGADARPLNIVLLMDTSGSLKSKLDFVKQAAFSFLRETLRENKDMAAAVQFDSEINLVQDFTFDLRLLENSIQSMLPAGGATKLFDAIWVSVEDLLKHEVGRNVVVVLSDGEDTRSVTSADEAMRAAQSEDVILSAIGIKSGRFASDFGRLKKLARSTGGLFFDSRLSLEELQEAFRKIHLDITNQYNIGYVSSVPERDGSFREIQVKVKRRGLKVNHRKGYYVPKPNS